LYGGKGGPVTLSVNAKQVGAILRSPTGHNTLFQVKLGGKPEPAILKDWLVDPTNGKLLHVDLMRVAMDVRMKVKVPVHTFGEPAGVKVQGGVFEVVTREVEVECLPNDIPTEFRMDVSGLMLGKQLRVGDLSVDPGRGREARGSCGSGRSDARRARSHQEGQEGSGGRRRCRASGSQGGKNREAREGREEREKVSVWMLKKARARAAGG
jgi:large subunit ribosomal protein L25